MRAACVSNRLLLPWLPLAPPPPTRTGGPQRFLLPGNSSRYAKDLLLGVRVLPTSPLVRKKLRDSGLRNQTGFAVSGIWRDKAFHRWVGSAGRAAREGGEGGRKGTRSRGSACVHPSIRLYPESAPRSQVSPRGFCWTAPLEVAALKAAPHSHRHSHRPAVGFAPGCTPGPQP